MNKSILILEENSIIHGLIASALDMDGLTLHHEFDPEEYVQKARALMPDLILLSNTDQEQDYSVCRELRADSSLSKVPLVLLANSRDHVGSASLEALRVEGVIRKPFEASDIQQQVNKHLNIVDLIGSAYDYKKSQSFRNEGINPLSNLEIIDSEILGFLQDSTSGTPSVSASVVLDVDFTEELDQEAVSTEPVSEAPGTVQTVDIHDAPIPLVAVEEDAPPPETDLDAVDMVGEDVLEKTLHPERAFEPVHAESDIDELDASFGTLAEDVPLEGADYDESAEFGGSYDQGDTGLGEMDEAGDVPAQVFTPEATVQDPLPEWGTVSDMIATEPGTEADGEGDLAWGATEPVLEVATDDAGHSQDDTGPEATGILEPEALEEVALAPEGFDQPLMNELEPEAPSLDEVEVELAGAEIDFVAGGDDDDENIELFETDLEPDVALDRETPEVIPDAVRRMTELRPVFSKRTRDPEPETAPPGFVPGDDELASMTNELAQMDEFDVAGTTSEPSPTLEVQSKEGWKPPQSPSPANQSILHKEFLGDDEIDEGKIREALDHPVPKETERDGEFDVKELDGTEFPNLGEIDESEFELELDGAPEKLSSNPDGDAAVVEGALEGQPEVGPAASGVFPAEKTGGGATLVDPQLAALESSAAEADELLADKAEREMDADPDEIDSALSVATEDGEVPSYNDLGDGESNETALIAAEGEGGEPFFVTEDVSPETEESLWESEAESEIEIEAEGDESGLSYPYEAAHSDAVATEDPRQTAISPEDDEVPPAEWESTKDEDKEESVFDDDDFDAALRELQVEIEANPVGEHLDDVLAQEGVVEAVESLEFHIPRQEPVFTRAMGILDLGEQGAIDRAFIDRLVVAGVRSPAELRAQAALDAPAITAVSQPGAAVVADAPLVGLREEIVTRLSSALDDMIRDTVRRVVREEMPHIMEQTKDDTGGYDH